MIDEFWRDGFVVVPTFERDEIDALRADVLAELAERPRTSSGDLLGDLATMPRLHRIVLDERLLRLASSILDHTPVYFRDSNLSVDSAVTGWHKDNRQQDRTDQTATDWQGRYPLLRIGIYLQDHRRHSGGLSLRVGSHEPHADTPAYKVGQPIHVDSAVGDVVIWNLRMTHSGGSVRFRGIRGKKLSPRIERMAPSWLQAPAAARRMAIFTTYGAPSDHLDRYVAYLRTRDYFLDALERPPCEAFAAAAARSPITVIDP